MKQHTYFISDQAYEFLIKQVDSKWFLSRYLNLLSNSEFKDNRPEDYKSGDLIRLEQGLFPYWLEPADRIPRTLHLSIQAITNYANIANKFMISTDVAFALNKTRTAQTLTGYTLEAIGLELLVSTSVVIKPIMKETTRKQYMRPNRLYKHRELQW
jgi:hypothetical protein